eukprot:evm.model.scf_750.4 EVM.evm.TU.scf_750.4   scf_750:32786-37346(-)
MLLLVETAAGFALFKVLKEKKLKEAADLWKDFETLEKAQKVVQLKSFQKFVSTTEALAAATAIVDSKLGKGLKKFLKKKAGPDEQLLIVDTKLGNVIKEKLGIPCLYSQSVLELTRGVRNQLEGLISGLSSSNLQLGLSHSLSRYKLKFSPDKVDTMIVQAIGLLDDLDKELNTYAMRVREWYGWHYPEMGKIVTDNIQYAKLVKQMRVRENASLLDMSDIVDEETEQAVKHSAQISMGTEISEEDMNNISALCDQVIDLSDYRGQLFDYLKNRMSAIAPNLTALVGELVGARLIAHAGSLMNLAKHPGSTIQILGAEKALFRALKTKSQTPKYGLIFHASLIGQSAPKIKGKISRLLACKSALAVRFDALGDAPDASFGVHSRQQVEARLQQLEARMLKKLGVQAKVQQGVAKHDPLRQPGAGGIAVKAQTYDGAADVAMVKKEEDDLETGTNKKKRKHDKSTTKLGSPDAGIDGKLSRRW